jgi:hypothetical protein
MGKVRLPSIFDFKLRVHVYRQMGDLALSRFRLGRHFREKEIPLAPRKFKACNEIKGK